MLEAELIKKHQPPYNILQKDDKTFLYVEITHETFPRVLLVRGKEKRQMSNVKGQMSNRIEGYDISNISGTSAVGSMVVFNGDEPDKDEYRKFKIYTVKGSDDTGMLREVLARRLKHAEWTLPDLILVDGGRGQVNAVKSVLAECDLKIPTIGIAKGPERKKNEFIGKIPAWTSEHTLIRVRDEAHRFAIAYHKKLRAQTFHK